MNPSVAEPHADSGEAAPGAGEQEQTPYTLATVLKSISLMMAICAGAVENTIVIYTIVKERHLHRAPYYFIVNVCVADLLRSVLCLPLVLDAVLHGSVWRHGLTGCTLLAFSSTFFTFGAMFALFIVALDRHISIVHHSFHTRRFHGPMCLVVVLSGWGSAFLLAFPPVFGLGTYKFDALQAQCTFQHLYYTDNDTLGFTVIFVAMMALILFVYVRIFIFLRGHRKMRPVVYQAARSSTWAFFGAGGNVLAMNNLLNLGMARANTNPGPQHQPGQHQPFMAVRYHGITVHTQRNEHLTRVALCATFLYDISWLPYSVVALWYMFDPHRLVPWLLVTIATWLTYSQVATLPLLYIFCHKPFRQSMSRSISSNLDGYIATEQTAEA